MPEFDTALKTYMTEVARIILSGVSTEHSFRPALQAFIESWESGLFAINEPRHIKCGAPDFIVERKKTPLGYVECKDIGANLKKVEKEVQLQRYREALPNLILTDYLEFRWYENGEFKMSASLSVPSSGRPKVDPKEAQEFHALIQAFLSSQVATISSPKDLARRMAAQAVVIRDLIQNALEDEDHGGGLREQLEAFREVLLKDLQPAQFADMFAQTIAYGLFAAVVGHKQENPGRPFDRRLAAHYIPPTNPFLRKIFDQIAGVELEPRITWAVDHLALLLDRADIGAILADFGKRVRREDPVIHFYETFLAAYDPKMREARGVYYTPEPVVSYIVRSVDHILKTDFDIKDGLANSDKIKLAAPVGGKTECHRVLVLDPAAGTGTFLHSVIRNINATLTAKHQAGSWSAYVHEHLLPRIFGFELLMAPYAVAHMKLGLLLKQLGYDFVSGERLRVYLTNTLDEAFDPEGHLGMADIIAREAAEAGKVKGEFPVMVVLGNPPYSGHSANASKEKVKTKSKSTGRDIRRMVDTFIGGLIKDYYQVDGRPLGEKNPKWLQDDYVKFIRFAQWRIEKTGYGILAFINNNGYLDNPTFRGMRQSLMNTFDDIYILDLHGNSKKKEKAPGGGKDENVFDIQQGVAIGIFVKRKNTAKKKPANIRHAELWGPREIFKGKGEDNKLTGGKYKVLYETGVDSTKWKKVDPQGPFYLFTPQDRKLLDEYERGWKITDIMPVNSIGIATARDDLTVRWSENEIWKTVKEFVKMPTEDARSYFQLGKDSQDWKVNLAQEDLLASGPKKEYLRRILYRPFDVRWTYYTGKSGGFHCRPRPEIMKHMTEKNIAISTTRSVEIGRGWEHVFCSSQIIQLHTVSLKEVNYFFPLYLTPNGYEDLFDYSERSGEEEGVRKVNLAQGFILELSKLTGMKFGQTKGRNHLYPEDVFNYIYAVLHSPTYRSRYGEFLKIDFPRVPIPSNPVLFRKLCQLGEKLVSLHLLDESPKLITSYPVSGSDEVDQVRYVDLHQRVHINDDQYFGEVTKAVWEFHVGGYRVCERWLKDRKGRKLSLDDINHYQKIVAALSETISIMAEIDAVIAAHGGFPLA